MQSNDNTEEKKDARIVVIKGTGPKERPPMPEGLVKPPGANAGKRT